MKYAEFDAEFDRLEKAQFNEDIARLGKSDWRRVDRDVIRTLVRPLLKAGAYDFAGLCLVRKDAPGRYDPYQGHPGTHDLLLELGAVYERAGQGNKLKALWRRVFAARRAWFWPRIDGIQRVRTHPERYSKEGIAVTESNYASARACVLAGAAEYRKVLERHGTPAEVADLDEEVAAIEAGKPRKRQAPRDSRKMDEDVFWELIETSAEGAETPFDVADRLSTRLEAFKPKEILAFQKMQTRLLAAAYRWDLWAVAAILMGGSCSDDSFEYFRAWLLTRGRARFEAALREPERAAAGVEQGEEVENEDLLSAAQNAYLVTAKEGGADFEEKTAVKRQPALQGDPWEAADLPRLYPRLWKRFRPA